MNIDPNLANQSTTGILFILAYELIRRWGPVLLAMLRGTPAPTPAPIIPSPVAPAAPSSHPVLDKLAPLLPVLNQLAPLLPKLIPILNNPLANLLLDELKAKLDHEGNQLAANLSERLLPPVEPVAPVK